MLNVHTSVAATGPDNALPASPDSNRAADNSPAAASSRPEPTASLSLISTPQLGTDDLAQPRDQQVFTLFGQPLSAEEAAAVQRLRDLGEPLFLLQETLCAHLIQPVRPQVPST